MSVSLDHCEHRFTDATVVVLEKEIDCGWHASGRNSDVLHAGFYDGADSLKARFTREGNQRMTLFCKERGLRVKECGRLVVAQNEAALSGLDELLRRGQRNGVDVHRVTAQEHASSSRSRERTKRRCGRRAPRRSIVSR